MSSEIPHYNPIMTNVISHFNFNSWIFLPRFEIGSIRTTPSEDGLNHKYLWLDRTSETCSIRQLVLDEKFPVCIREGARNCRLCDLGHLSS